jgi:hypothetical protein
MNPCDLFSCTYSEHTMIRWTHFIKHYALKAYGGVEVQLRAFLISILNKTKWPASRVCHLTFHRRDPCSQWIGSYEHPIATLDTGIMAEEMLRFWGSDFQTKIFRPHSRIRLSRPIYSNRNRPKLNAPLKSHWRSSISVALQANVEYGFAFPCVSVLFVEIWYDCLNEGATRQSASTYTG